jgi:hypothetical protein
MQKLDVSKEEAERKLDDAGGLIRRVVPGPPPEVETEMHDSPVAI